jgi:formylglycine-generating enzyme required for sulfatase activity
MHAPFALGPGLTPIKANFRDGGLGQATPVGTYPPNAWGLYDMHGNVAEWCADWYRADYYDVSPAVDPPGPRTGTRRVVRGGWWDSAPEDCRSGKRFDTFAPGDRREGVGFRVVCTEADGK